MKETPVVTVENNLVYITTKRLASTPELENALWLRQNHAGLIASAFHGGHAEGFHIAISDVTTEQIEAALKEKNNV